MTQNENCDWPPQKPDDKNKWSNTELTILRLLWDGERVNREKIFEETGQTYYDRRIRELREQGWDIEAIQVGSDYFYQLKSHKKEFGTKREYANKQLREAVLNRDKKCVICGSEENLQVDHKIPRERNGKTNIENLQILCLSCNVEKRGICKKCERENCDKCPYAFPELYENKVIVFLEKDLNKEIKKISESKGVYETEVINQILRRFLKR